MAEFPKLRISKAHHENILASVFNLPVQNLSRDEVFLALLFFLIRRLYLAQISKLTFEANDAAPAETEEEQKRRKWLEAVLGKEIGQTVRGLPTGFSIGLPTKLTNQLWNLTIKVDFPDDIASRSFIIPVTEDDINSLKRFHIPSSFSEVTELSSAVEQRVQTEMEVSGSSSEVTELPSAVERRMQTEMKVSRGELFGVPVVVGKQRVSIEPSMDPISSVQIPFKAGNLKILAVTSSSLFGFDKGASISKRTLKRMDGLSGTNSEVEKRLKSIIILKDELAKVEKITFFRKSQVGEFTTHVEVLCEQYQMDLGNPDLVKLYLSLAGAQAGIMKFGISTIFRKAYQQLMEAVVQTIAGDLTRFQFSQQLSGLNEQIKTEKYRGLFRGWFTRRLRAANLDSIIAICDKTVKRIRNENQEKALTATHTAQPAKMLSIEDGAINYVGEVKQKEFLGQLRGMWLNTVLPEEVSIYRTTYRKLSAIPTKNEINQQIKFFKEYPVLLGYLKSGKIAQYNEAAKKLAEFAEELSQEVSFPACRVVDWIIDFVKSNNDANKKHAVLTALADSTLLTHLLEIHFNKGENNIARMLEQQKEDFLNTISDFLRRDSENFVRDMGSFDTFVVLLDKLTLTKEEKNRFVLNAGKKIIANLQPNKSFRERLNQLFEKIAIISLPDNLQDELNVCALDYLVKEIKRPENGDAWLKQFRALTDERGRDLYWHKQFSLKVTSAIKLQAIKNNLERLAQSENYNELYASQLVEIIKNCKDGTSVTTIFGVDLSVAEPLDFSDSEIEFLLSQVLLQYAIAITKKAKTSTITKLEMIKSIVDTLTKAYLATLFGGAKKHEQEAFLAKSNSLFTELQRVCKANIAELFTFEDEDAIPGQILQLINRYITEVDDTYLPMFSTFCQDVRELKKNDLFAWAQAGLLEKMKTIDERVYSAVCRKDECAPLFHQEEFSLQEGYSTTHPEFFSQNEDPSVAAIGFFEKVSPDYIKQMFGRLTPDQLKQWSDRARINIAFTGHSGARKWVENHGGKEGDFQFFNWNDIKGKAKRFELGEDRGIGRLPQFNNPLTMPDSKQQDSYPDFNSDALNSLPISAIKEHLYQRELTPFETHVLKSFSNALDAYQRTEDVSAEDNASLNHWQSTLQHLVAFANAHVKDVDLDFESIREHLATVNRIYNSLDETARRLTRETLIHIWNRYRPHVAAKLQSFSTKALEPATIQPSLQLLGNIATNFPDPGEIVLEGQESYLELLGKDHLEHNDYIQKLIDSGGFCIEFLNAISPQEERLPGRGSVILSPNFKNLFEMKNIEFLRLLNGSKSDGGTIITQLHRARQCFDYAKTLHHVSTDRSLWASLIHYLELLILKRKNMPANLPEKLLRWARSSILSAAHIEMLRAAPLEKADGCDSDFDSSSVDEEGGDRYELSFSEKCDAIRGFLIFGNAAQKQAAANYWCEVVATNRDLQGFQVLDRKSKILKEAVKVFQNVELTAEIKDDFLKKAKQVVTKLVCHGLFAEAKTVIAKLQLGKAELAFVTAVENALDYQKELKSFIENTIRGKGEAFGQSFFSPENLNEENRALFNKLAAYKVCQSKYSERCGKQYWQSNFGEFECYMVSVAEKFLQDKLKAEEERATVKETVSGWLQASLGSPEGVRLPEIPKVNTANLSDYNLLPLQAAAQLALSTVGLGNKAELLEKQLPSVNRALFRALSVASPWVSSSEILDSARYNEVLNERWASIQPTLMLAYAFADAECKRRITNYQRGLLYYYLYHKASFLYRSRRDVEPTPRRRKYAFMEKGLRKFEPKVLQWQELDTEHVDHREAFLFDFAQMSLQDELHGRFYMVYQGLLLVKHVFIKDRAADDPAVIQIDQLIQKIKSQASKLEINLDGLVDEEILAADVRDEKLKPSEIETLVDQAKSCLSFAGRVNKKRSLLDNPALMDARIELMCSLFPTAEPFKTEPWMVNEFVLELARVMSVVHRHEDSTVVGGTEEAARLKGLIKDSVLPVLQTFIKALNDAKRLDYGVIVEIERHQEKIVDCFDGKETSDVAVNLKRLIQACKERRTELFDPLVCCLEKKSDLEKRMMELFHGDEAEARALSLENVDSDFLNRVVSVSSISDLHHLANKAKKTLEIFYSAGMKSWQNGDVSAGEIKLENINFKHFVQCYKILVRLSQEPTISKKERNKLRLYLNIAEPTGKDKPKSSPLDFAIGEALKGRYKKGVLRKWAFTTWAQKIAFMLHLGQELNSAEAEAKVWGCIAQVFNLQTSVFENDKPEYKDSPGFLASTKINEEDIKDLLEYLDGNGFVSALLDSSNDRTTGLFSSGRLSNSGIRKVVRAIADKFILAVEKVPEAERKSLLGDTSRYDDLKKAQQEQRTEEEVTAPVADGAGVATASVAEVSDGQEGMVVPKPNPNLSALSRALAEGKTTRVPLNLGDALSLGSNSALPSSAGQLGKAAESATDAAKREAKAMFESYAVFLISDPTSIRPTRPFSKFLHQAHSIWLDQVSPKAKFRLNEPVDFYMVYVCAVINELKASADNTLQTVLSSPRDQNYFKHAMIAILKAGRISKVWLQELLKNVSNAQQSTALNDQLTSAKKAVLSAAEIRSPAEIPPAAYTIN